MSGAERGARRVLHDRREQLDIERVRAEKRSAVRQQEGRAAPLARGQRCGGGQGEVGVMRWTEIARVGGGRGECA